MKGYNLVKSASETFTLVDGELCERHISVYQSQRSENAFKVVTTDIINGEPTESIEKGNRAFIKCCLISALGDDWNKNWGVQIH
ncbi:hypothetical protein [Lonepinella sp. BR2271]|uniref:hypothetical protein n=1 Tax=Lonepinella sp. BR2271 TaxID=3434550 RepID=UPI003F6DE69B